MAKTATVSISSLASKALELLIRTAIVLVFGPGTLKLKSTVSFAHSAFGRRKTRSLGLSLDPALVKVPFSALTTYVTVLHNYINISALTCHQMLGHLSKYASSPDVEEFLKGLGTNKEQYGAMVANGCLKVSEVLQLAASDDLKARPPPRTPSPEAFLSIPKLNPTSIHITPVALKYQSVAREKLLAKWIYRRSRPVHRLDRSPHRLLWQVEHKNSAKKRAGI
ncbi:hypothetical protein FIBSPDRAFT_968732 [Athelia psychrophila]|uniref:Uncharacterized protein n=1 Tax=Athelia psychrophila TaxID=1759441 RepID=A0A167UA43_9AGAM|nr:hypothetical protein FIBSPDRAFT_968732 [Fibularhizoctonia sp. CBS 109695]